VGAAQTFFRRALQKHGDPLSITLDAYAAWHRAVPEFKESGEMLYPKRRVRSCASLHPVVEPDPRGVKRRVNPMLGFRSLEKARVVIAGIEHEGVAYKEKGPAPINPRIPVRQFRRLTSTQQLTRAGLGANSILNQVVPATA
jgi:transposase-like protein